MAPETEQAGIAELARDYLVFAPIGLAVVGLGELPRLSERRRSIEKRLQVAETIGRLVVGEMKRRASASWAPSDGPVPASPRLSVLEGSGPIASGPAGEPGTHGTGAHVAGTGTIGLVELPIPAYDTLAASQVVERLASLTPAELEAVRQHEAATRRRRTVLHRIAQLGVERDGSSA